MSVMTRDGSRHVAEVVVQDAHRDGGVEPIAQGREAAQVGKQHRHLASLGREGVGGVGEPFHHVGRHEALELTLQLLQLVIGGQQQLLELVVLAAAAQHEHRQA